MNDRKIALAITEKTYFELATRGCRDMFAERDHHKMVKRIETPDGSYRILLWDWECPDPEIWNQILKYLENRRHSLIDISDEGVIRSSVVTEDDEGSDGVFEEILGWTSNIVLWQDMDDVLV